MKGKRDSCGHEDSLRASMLFRAQHSSGMSEAKANFQKVHRQSFFLSLSGIVDENLNDSRSLVSRRTVSPYLLHFSRGNSPKVSIREGCPEVRSFPNEHRSVD